ncbi:hypothetical protein ACTFIR_007584 [Dictyostelium discoideum]
MNMVTAAFIHPEDARRVHRINLKIGRLRGRELQLYLNKIIIEEKDYLDYFTWTGRRFCTGCIYLRSTQYGGIVCWSCARIARVKRNRKIVSYEAYLNKLAREQRGMLNYREVQQEYRREYIVISDDEE